MFNELYLSVPQVSCFDGDDANAGDANAGDANAGDANADGGNTGDAGKTFNTAEVNKIVEERLARDRKSQGEKLKVKYEELQATHNTLLENKNLSDEERGKLETSLDDVTNRLRTKEERAKHEKQTLQSEFDTQLQKEREDREMWEGRFRNDRIHRDLQDAAVTHDAYNADQVVRLLSPMTKLTPVTDDTGKENGQFKTVVDFPDHDEKGEEVTFSGTPDDIVKRMRDLGNFKNLFKVNVVAGLGAGNATDGVSSGPNGRVDQRKLTPEQFRKLHKENPALVGM